MSGIHLLVMAGNRPACAAMSGGAAVTLARLARRSEMSKVFSCAAALADAQARKVDSVVPSVCVFDVNETLLDIEFIAPIFQRLFGDRKACASGLDNSSSIRTQ